MIKISSVQLQNFYLTQSCSKKNMTAALKRSGYVYRPRNIKVFSRPETCPTS